MNFATLSQEEIGNLQKIHILKTEVVRSSPNRSRAKISFVPTCSLS